MTRPARKQSVGRPPGVVSCASMPRLARWLFTLCSAASTLLCVTACVLWVRSYAGGDSASRLVGRHRYTLRSEQGRIALMRPPRAVDGLDRWITRSPRGAPQQGERGARGSVDAFVRRMSNDHIEWEAIRVASGPRRGELEEVFFFPGNDAFELWPPHSHRGGDLIPALLTALEQPDK